MQQITKLQIATVMQLISLKHNLTTLITGVSSAVQDTTLSVVSDLCKIVKELITQRAFCWTPGLTYKHFYGINSTL